ncbi:MAG: alpha-1,2-fucosyltransferase [Sphingobacteriaceae bacterium]|nr:alpha-1,2-fucosyltransferase [Sphingobacteriaceae bacterium]
MIIVRLQGGLGNQMFQYAFGKTLALKNNTVLKLDLTLLNSSNNADNAIKRDFELDIFNFKYELANENEIAFYNGYPNGNIFQRLLYKFQKFVHPRNLIIQEGNLFNPVYLETSDNACVVGRWQSEKYFEACRGEIINELTIKEELLTNSNYEREILNSNYAVSLHVRREDVVLDNQKKVKRVHLGYNTLSIEYYQKAINYFINENKNCKFFIFSEDLDWCKKNLDFITNAVFVETEKSKKGMAADLHLMSICKSYITSNSTFSWWGAYLGKHQDKKIIAPIEWVNSTFELSPRNIFPESWIKI